MCGNDGKTYHNNCELHRTACVEKRKIHVDYRGACKKNIWRKFQKKKAVTKPNRPVACYQVERDELHMMLVRWMYTMATTNKWIKREEMLNDLETNIFKMCDLDHDGFVISSEFLMCTERNDSKTSSSEIRTHRELCIDAIIDMADKNGDWKFNLEEFKHVFNKDYTPPTSKCSLKKHSYEDGYEIGFHCNTCVCACGKWVCASASCGKDNTLNEGKLHKGKLPGNKMVKKFLKGFIASDLIEMKKVQKDYRKTHYKYTHHKKF